MTFELQAPGVSLLAFAVLLQVVVGLLRAVMRGGSRLQVAVVGGWGGTVLWRGYRALREEVSGLDYIAAGLLLLPIAVLISLGKGGALRTVTARRDPARE